MCLRREQGPSSSVRSLAARVPRGDDGVPPAVSRPPRSPLALRCAGAAGAAGRHPPDDATHTLAVRPPPTLAPARAHIRRARRRCTGAAHDCRTPPATGFRRRWAGDPASGRAGVRGGVATTRTGWPSPWTAHAWEAGPVPSVLEAWRLGRSPPRHPPAAPMGTRGRCGRHWQADAISICYCPGPDAPASASPGAAIVYTLARHAVSGARRMSTCAAPD